MRIAMFYHSLMSDWNHGNAHFLRGIVTELLARGHDIRVYEPENGWSFRNLVADGGERAVEEFRTAFPALRSTQYNLDSFDFPSELEGVDLVMVHEWNHPEVLRRLADCRSSKGYRLLFHDTHHRAITDRERMGSYDFGSCDAVLAFGSVIRDIYLAERWTKRAWTWHEAADVRVFHPIHDVELEGDLVWIGNWGDGERSAELQEFLLEPVKRLRLKARVYGVRYPASALQALRDSGIEYGGWLPNYLVPQVFARFRVTVHVPRRPYVRSLPGIPTIRVFEALACGIPLVCAPWEDTEGLFTPGEDYLVAHSVDEMTAWLEGLIRDREMATKLALHGRSTILARHTCSHRVDELLQICRELEVACGASATDA